MAFFKFTKPVEGSVGCYGGVSLKTGEVIELDGFLAEKAGKNPDYELVEEFDGKAKKIPKPKKSDKDE